MKPKKILTEDEVFEQLVEKNRKAKEKKSTEKREKKFEEKLTEEVEALKGLAIKFSSPYFTGVPDRIVLMPGGRIWFVELKSTNKPPSPRQKIVIPQLIKLGFKVWVIDSSEDLSDFLEVIQRDEI